MPPHFLTIPGEIRNRIYEYALTQPEGVYYREDKAATGQLCLHDTYDEKAEVFDMKQDTSDDGWSKTSEVDEDDLGDESTKTHCAVEEKLGHNEVDGEISFGSSSPAFERLQEVSHVRVSGGQIVANQMRFVCRQLASETNALCLRHNTVWFHENEKGRSSKLCAEFLQLLSTKARSSLRTIAIKDTGEWPTVTILPLVAFCYDNSATQVLWYDSHNVKDENFVGRLYFHIFRLGKQLPFLDSVSTWIRQEIFRAVTTWIEQVGERTGASLERVSECPENFRVFLTDEPIGSLKFLRMTEKDRLIRDVYIPNCNGGSEAFLQFAKDITTNGF